MNVSISDRYDPQTRKESIDGDDAVVVDCSASFLFRDLSGNEFDRQMKRDVEMGRLDEIAQQIKEDYEAGLTTPL